MDYASLLLRSMAADMSEGGRRFRAEDDALYRRYARLLYALCGHEVSGFAAPGVPPFALIDTYFEIVLHGEPVRIPKPRPLTPEQQAESARRVEVVHTVATKAHNKWMRDGSERADPADATRFHRVHNAVWSWALQIERSVNPIKMRVSRRAVVSRYLHDVTDFCDRWRLRADWARNLIIDHHFARAAWGHDGFLPAIDSGVWSGDETLVVRVPGSDDTTYERDRVRFVRCQMATTEREGSVAPLTLTWSPNQHEQRAFEREHHASCVVVRYEAFSFPNRDDRLLNYVTDECAFRLGRPVTKRETRDLLRQLDPQLRAIRERLLARGWHVASRADLQTHAGWLARKLVGGYSWNRLIRVLGSEPTVPTDVSVVRRACSAYAAHAGLNLREPAPLRS